MLGKILSFFVVLVLSIVGYALTFGRDLSHISNISSINNVEMLCLLHRAAPEIIGGLAIPYGAQHEKEIIWRETPPAHFGAVLALMQVVTVAPCPLLPEEEATLSIRAMRLIERDPVTREERIISEVTDFSNQDTVRFDGELFPRFPQWYEGAGIKPPENMKHVAEGVLTLDLKQTPNLIYHGWTDPKAPTRPGKQYLVEMEAKITGLARLQLGIDYWRDTAAAFTTFDSSCEKSNNCEGYLSEWFGPSADWQTLRAPYSFGR